MSLSEVLSQSLRRLCDGEASIEAVCRGTGINRQQFNRYLSGSSMPNQSNRKRICRYFRIEEEELFCQVTDSPDVSKTDEEAWWSHGDLRSILKSIYSEPVSSVPPGLYFANFTIPFDKKSIVRSTLVVRNERNLTTFRRLTAHYEPRESWWSNYKGDHGGLILDRRNWIYMVGLNRTGNREPSLLILRWLANTRPTLAGTATIFTPLGPAMTAVVVNACQVGMSLRSAIRASHVYSSDDPNIDPIVIDALEQHDEFVSTADQHPLGYLTGKLNPVE